MARRRYSAQDQHKMVQDSLADFRAKGIDARAISPLHPGGVVETIKTMKKELSSVRDQSQEQTERSRRKHQQAVKEGNARVTEEARKFKKV